MIALNREDSPAKTTNGNKQGTVWEQHVTGYTGKSPGRKHYRTSDGHNGEGIKNATIHQLIMWTHFM